MLSPDPLFLDALTDDSLAPVWLVDLPAGLSWTTHDRPLVVDSITYEAVGQVIAIPSLPRFREIRQHGITLTLAGVDIALLSRLSDPAEIGALCRFRLGLLNAAGALIAGRVLNMYQGTFDGLTYSDGGSGEADERIQLKIIGPWSKPSRTAGRLTSDSSQQDYSAGDRFMEFAHEKLENLTWGEET